MEDKKEKEQKDVVVEVPLSEVIIVTNLEEFIKKTLQEKK